jgi:hypothetical protein
MPAAKKRKKKSPPRSDAKQSSRFLETAKKLEVDESGAAFARALDAVVPKPKGNE